MSYKPRNYRNENNKQKPTSTGGGDKEVVVDERTKFRWRMKSLLEEKWLPKKKEERVK